jgi:hypothetical protein
MLAAFVEKNCDDSFAGVLEMFAASELASFCRASEGSKLDGSITCGLYGYMPVLRKEACRLVDDSALE